MKLDNIFRWDKTCNSVTCWKLKQILVGITNSLKEEPTSSISLAGQFGSDFCENFIKTLCDLGRISYSPSIELNLINCSFIRFTTCYLIDSCPCFTRMSIVSIKKCYNSRTFFTFLILLFTSLRKVLKLFQSLGSPVRLNFKTISPIHQGLLEALTCLVRSGACKSHTFKNRDFHFIYISFGLSIPMRSTHGWAKMSERNRLRSNFLNCLYETVV